MTLLRTSALNGVAVAIRMATTLVLNKVLAIYVGPAGYAVMGQFQNALAMAVTFATGATGNGVVKLTAEYARDEKRQHRLWQTAGTLIALASVMGALAIVMFRHDLAVLFLHDQTLSSVFVWLALCLPLIAFNALLLSIMSGRKDIRRFIHSNIAGSFVSLLLTGALAWRFGLYGALVALSVNQGVLLLVTLQQAMRTEWFGHSMMLGRIDRTETRRLGGFVIMALTTAIVSPVSQILVRNAVIADFGLNYAGYWDAMWRISTLYLTLVTTTLTLYYLPRIAEIDSWPEMKSELVKVFRFVFPVVVILSSIIYMLRNVIITILFARDFLPMHELFGWQMAGDVAKISAWLLAFLMIGRGLTKSYVATEIVSGLVFWLATLVFTRLFGFRGVAIAHFFNYVTYAGLVALLTIATPSRRAALFSAGRHR